MSSGALERISALSGHLTSGRFGAEGEVGVILREVPDLTLTQAAAWPETLSLVGAKAAEAVGAEAVPGPGQAVVGSGGALLRIEPLKYWLLGAAAPALAPDQGATLDLSHSRSHLRISGPQAAGLLNRHLPLDLRDESFQIGSVAATAFHHCGVALWRSEAGFELFLPRGFALSLWEMLLDSAAQFGCQVE